MPEYGTLFNFDNFVHNTPIIFVTLVSYFFSFLDSFVQKSSDVSRVPYIALFAYAYMHFPVAIYLDEVLVLGWVDIFK